MHASTRCSSWLLAVLVAAPAIAAEDLGEALAACRKEAEDARRLACYDRVAGRSATPSPAPAPEPEPAAAAASAAGPAAPAAPLPPEDSFGRERQIAYEENQKRKDESRSVGKVEATVTDIDTRFDGLMTFTLSNGQIWRQNAPDSRFSVKAGDLIRIQPGSLGSYILSGPTKKSTRVTRVK
jgi:hypothetical protein